MSIRTRLILACILIVLIITTFKKDRGQSVKILDHHFIEELSRSDESTDNKPNIVLVVADDLGWSEVGYNNPYVITPTLDSMARDGVILNQLYVSSSCSPTRAALMTGYYAYRLGFQDRGLLRYLPTGIPLNRTLFPQKLRQLGYSTYMLGKWHLGFCKYDYTPNGRGFDHFYGYYLASEDHYTHTGGKYLDLRENLTPDWNENGTYSTDLFSLKAVKYINSHNTEKPLFMYLAFSNVHSPLQVPNKYVDIYPMMERGRRMKLGMISAVDDAVDTVVTAMKSRGMWENTVFIFMSDNGAPVNDRFFGNNWPYRGGKGTLWEGGTRAVSFIHDRRLKKQGYAYDGLMHVVDWYPTILSLAGGKATDPDMDGLNMWESISQNSVSPRTEFVYNINVEGDPGAAIRMDEYKLIIGKANNPANWIPPIEANGTLGEPEFAQAYVNDLYLFNLKADPTERNNLAGDRPAKVREMKERLEQFKEKLVPAFDPNAGIPDLANPANFGGAWSTGWC
ncbi:arylsulfatase B-like isoform X2 [Glandiceps talaboti]